MAIQKLKNELLEKFFQEKLNKYGKEKYIRNQDNRKTLIAVNLENQENVVIKVRLFESNSESSKLEFIESKLKSLRQINHGNIPEYIDYFKINLENIRGFILIQKYISESQSLENYLQSGRKFSEYEIKQLAKKLLETLNYLHSQDIPIIHGNIKPSNILLKNRSGNSIGEVYLVDFSFPENLYHGDSFPEKNSKDYIYISPEQFEYLEISISPQSDLFSLGTTLAYAATGVEPVNFNNEAFCLLSRGLVYWLHWMKEPSLQRRLSSAKEASGALEKIAVISELLEKSDRKYEKPQGSKVFLNKNSEFLEVTIPAVGFYSKATLIYLIPIVSSSIFSIYFCLTNNISSNHLLIFLWFCLSSFTSFVLFLIACISTFSIKKLFIDNQQIYLAYYLFSKKISIYPENYKIDTAYLEYDQDNKNQHFLRICLGRNQYELSTSVLSFFALTKSEIYWLADEVSHWLDTTINRKQNKFNPDTEKL
ncbi:MAG: protein kinase family protein [Cyanobacteria bacterium P01_A01_bin.45]